MSVFDRSFILGLLPESKVGELAPSKEEESQEQKTFSNQQEQTLEGSFRETNDFFFDKSHVLDAFVVATFEAGSGKIVNDIENPSGVYIKFIPVKGSTFPPSSCHFSTPGEYESPFKLFEGGDAYECQVPQPVVDSIESESQEYLQIKLAMDDNKEVVDVKAALYPYHLRHRRYNVVVTNMNKNVNCVVGDHCIHDWIIYHRNYGVDHFFIYENDSDKNHPWLKSIMKYVEDGTVTLINWPYNIETDDIARKSQFKNNKMGQKASLNHAGHMLSSRTKWFGRFDVDEFVTPYSVIQNNSEMAKMKLVDILDSTAMTFEEDEDKFISLQVPMRSAQNPDHCAETADELIAEIDEKSTYTPINRTTLLSRCTSYHMRKKAEGNPKTFLRFGANGPVMQHSPHRITSKEHQETINTLEMIHFTHKLRCTRSRYGCENYEDIALSPEVYRMEKQLELFDKGLLGPCENSNVEWPSCY